MPALVFAQPSSCRRWRLAPLRCVFLSSFLQLRLLSSLPTCWLQARAAAQSRRQKRVQDDMVCRCTLTCVPA